MASKRPPKVVECLIILTLHEMTNFEVTKKFDHAKERGQPVETDFQTKIAKNLKNTEKNLRKSKNFFSKVEGVTSPTLLCYGLSQVCLILETHQLKVFD